MGTRKDWEVVNGSLKRAWEVIRDIENRLTQLERAFERSTTRPVRLKTPNGKEHLVDED